LKSCTTITRVQIIQSAQAVPTCDQPKTIRAELRIPPRAATPRVKKKVHARETDGEDGVIKPTLKSQPILVRPHCQESESAVQTTTALAQEWVTQYF
jgi:hypothetical protein